MLRVDQRFCSRRVILNAAHPGAGLRHYHRNLWRCSAPGGDWDCCLGSMRWASAVHQGAQDRFCPLCRPAAHSGSAGSDCRMRNWNRKVNAMPRMNRILRGQCRVDHSVMYAAVNCSPVDLLAKRLQGGLGTIRNRAGRKMNRKSVAPKARRNLAGHWLASAAMRTPQGGRCDHSNREGAGMTHSPVFRPVNCAAKNCRCGCQANSKYCGSDQSVPPDPANAMPILSCQNQKKAELLGGDKNCCALILRHPHHIHRTHRFLPLHRGRHHEPSRYRRHLVF